MSTYYKFLNSDRRAENTGYQWPEPGEWTPPVKGDLVACENGYHLCRPQDLSHWINSDLWECEAGAEIVESDTKIVTRTARLVRRVDTWNERTQRLFACDCAERALTLVGDPDPRSVEAVRVARLYAVGEADKEQLAAAWAAAWAAAQAAARDAAWSAAQAAARDAAQAAARDAAWSAAWSAARAAARDAAWSAARDAARAAARAWQSERVMFYISGETDKAAL